MAQTFEQIAEGWVFCTLRLLKHRWERCRALAKTDAQRTVVAKMLAKYLEDKEAAMREVIKEGGDVKPYQLVLQRGLAAHDKGRALRLAKDPYRRKRTQIRPTARGQGSENVLPRLQFRLQTRENLGKVGQARHRGLAQCLVQERLGLHAAVALLHQHLHLALGSVQLLLARAGERDALLKELQRLLQRQVALFELADNGFELAEGLFKIGHGACSSVLG